MNVIGKKSLQPLITTIAGVIMAGIAIPLIINATMNIEDGFIHIFLALFFGLLACIIIYNAYFFITLPKDIIILDEENKTVTVYVTRRKKKTFKTDEIKSVSLRRPTRSYRRIVAHIVFETNSGERAVARFITDPESVTFALSRVK